MALSVTYRDILFVCLQTWCKRKEGPFK